MSTVTVGRAIVVAIAAAAAVTVAVAHRGTPLAAAALAAMVVVLAVLSDIDLRTQRLPNRLVGPLAIATVAGVAIAGAVVGDLERSATAVAIGVVFVVALLTANIAGGMGMGDVKLGFPIGVVAGWFGTDAVLATAFVGAVAGGLAAVVVMILARRRSLEFSYGPYLALGSVAGMIVGAG